MSIRHWPAQERPREKLLARGPEALSDAEVLAIFLRTGSRGKTAVDLARELLQQAGGLRALLDLPVASLRRLPGMGEARLALLQAALELGRRHLAAGMSREASLSTPEDAGRFLLARLRGYRHEVFACLFLDTKHRVIAFEELFRGTIDGAAVYPREVARRCLELNAAALIVSHNHPSGVAEPSESDRQLTRRLQQALSLLDVRLLDHLVIGDQDWISLAARGWI